MKSPTAAAPPATIAATAATTTTTTDVARARHDIVEVEVGVDPPYPSRGPHGQSD